jgi:hypothetical protein
LGYLPPIEVFTVLPIKPSFHGQNGSQEQQFGSSWEAG